MSSVFVTGVTCRSAIDAITTTQFTRELAKCPNTAYSVRLFNAERQVATSVLAVRLDGQLQTKCMGLENEVDRMRLFMDQHMGTTGPTWMLVLVVIGIAFPDLSHLGRVEAYVRRHRPATSFAALSNFESAPIVIGERPIDGARNSNGGKLSPTQHVARCTSLAGVMDVLGWSEDRLEAETKVCNAEKNGAKRVTGRTAVIQFIDLASFIATGTWSVLADPKTTNTNGSSFYPGRAAAGVRFKQLIEDVLEHRLLVDANGTLAYDTSNPIGQFLRDGAQVRRLQDWLGQACEGFVIETLTDQCELVLGRGAYSGQAIADDFSSALFKFAEADGFGRSLRVVLALARRYCLRLIAGDEAECKQQRRFWDREDEKRAATQIIKDGGINLKNLDAISRARRRPSPRPKVSFAVVVDGYAAVRGEKRRASWFLDAGGNLVADEPKSTSERDRARMLEVDPATGESYLYESFACLCARAQHVFAEFQHAKAQGIPLRVKELIKGAGDARKSRRKGFYILVTPDGHFYGGFASCFCMRMVTHLMDAKSGKGDRLTQAKRKHPFDEWGAYAVVVADDESLTECHVWESIINVSSGAVALTDHSLGLNTAAWDTGFLRREKMDAMQVSVFLLTLHEHVDAGGLIPGHLGTRGKGAQYERDWLALRARIPGMTVIASKTMSALVYREYRHYLTDPYFAARPFGRNAWAAEGPQTRR